MVKYILSFVISEIMSIVSFLCKIYCFYIPFNFFYTNFELKIAYSDLYFNSTFLIVSLILLL